jgi:hypothetical protein
LVKAVILQHQSALKNCPFEEHHVLRDRGKLICGNVDFL